MYADADDYILHMQILLPFDITFPLSQTHKDWYIPSYVTPKLLGGSKFRMMATMVVQEINVSFDWGAAAAISYILLAVILLVQLLVTLSTAKYMKRMGGGKNA